MPRGPKGEKRPADVIGNAVHVMRIATGDISETAPTKSGKVRSGKAGGEGARESLIAAKAAIDSQKGGRSALGLKARRRCPQASIRS